VAGRGLGTEAKLVSAARGALFPGKTPKWLQGPEPKPHPHAEEDRVVLVLGKGKGRPWQIC
jgi:hypothetical protein